MVEIGESAKAYAERRGNEDEVWIKGFKDGSTRIRFVQPTETFHAYKEHYDDGVGFFPCIWPGDVADCVGCNDASEKVRMRVHKYAFNALDQNGRLSVYKIGSRLYRTLQNREQRLLATGDQLMSRDYEIIRSGKGLETDYYPEPGEKYEVKLPKPEELHNVKQILNEKYASTAAAYGEPLPDQPNTTPAAEPATEPIKVDKTEESGTDTPLEAKIEEKVEGNGFGTMTTPKLKEWLTEHKIEFPPGAPRSRLIKLAELAAEVPY